MKRFFIIFLIILTGCDLFSTREPELPNAGASSFIPPTSPDIVIENFKASIIELNIDNYKSCLPENIEGNADFTFNPSAEALGRFPSIFENWTVNDEESWFLSIQSSLTQEVYPIMVLENSKFDLRQPDSAVFISDYYLNIEHTRTNIPTEYSGVLQFTIKINDSGMWHIHRWSDAEGGDETIKSTWSILKGEFYN